MIFRAPLFFLCAASIHALNIKLNVQIDGGSQYLLSGEQADDSSAWDKEHLDSAPDLPIVDLGYVKHQAVYNLNPDLYHFQSIRYAAPPTGDLRFKAPQPPLASSNGAVENGIGRRECPQATVKWAQNFPNQTFNNPDCCETQPDLEGKCSSPCNSKKLITPDRNLFGGFQPPLTNPLLYSEDCLHLDVWAPKTSFNKTEDKAPVLVWIYGGAYIFGGKSLYLPGGLLNRTLIEEGPGMVFVSMNYRMGAFGFAAGKDIADEDINAGLLDQQQALKWVKEHIGKFGGDPDQVTIAGLSAGGGSVIHHLTAYGGEQKESLFRRAVSLSGGWAPVTNKTRAEATFQDFMKLNGVKTIDELRKLPENQLIRANYDQIQKAPPGNFLYQPTAWGTFSPKSASKLLEEGKFNGGKEILISNTYDEGGKFSGVFKDAGTSLDLFLNLTLPDLDPDEREWVIDTYNYTYADETPKAPDKVISDIIADVTFNCPLVYVRNAYYSDSRLFQQQWNITNSNGHGGDLLYMFWQPFVPVASTQAALVLQDYITSFSTFGFPFTGVSGGSDTPFAPYYWTQYDGKFQMINSNSTGFPKITRESQNRDVAYACQVWQSFGST